jgi:hypothetical protein
LLAWQHRRSPARARSLTCGSDAGSHHCAPSSTGASGGSKW